MTYGSDSKATHTAQNHLRPGVTLLGQRTQFAQGSREITSLICPYPCQEVRRMNRHEQGDNEQHGHPGGDPARQCLAVHGVVLYLKFCNLV